MTPYRRLSKSASCGRFGFIFKLLIFRSIFLSSLAQTDQGPTAPFVGCYEVKLGRWWPWGFGEDGLFVTPPQLVQLLPEKGTDGFERDGFLIRAVTATRKGAGGRGRTSYWRVDSANRVSLIWNDGFTGVTIELKKDGDKLHGWAHPHFDAPHFLPRTAHVVAQRVSCDATADSKKAPPPRPYLRGNHHSHSIAESKAEYYFLRNVLTAVVPLD